MQEDEDKKVQLERFTSNKRQVPRQLIRYSIYTIILIIVVYFFNEYAIRKDAEDEEIENTIDIIIPTDTSN